MRFWEVFVFFYILWLMVFYGVLLCRVVLSLGRRNFRGFGFRKLFVLYFRRKCFFFIIR